MSLDAWFENQDCLMTAPQPPKLNPSSTDNWHDPSTAHGKLPLDGQMEANPQQQPTYDPAMLPGAMPECHDATEQILLE